MSKFKKVSIVVGITAALAFAADAPAFAAGTAYNEHPTQFLTASPSSSNPEACIVKSITLDAGTYTWKVYISAETGGNFRQIKLAAGKYKWDDCLQPEAGKYHQVSILTPTSFNGDSAVLDQYDSLASDGNYYWGSYLALN